MKLYLLWSFWWNWLPILGNSKSRGISLPSKREPIFFLKTTSSSSILGLMYLSSLVGQKPQKALEITFPCLVFSSTPKMSVLSFCRISWRCRSCCFSFIFVFTMFLSIWFFEEATCWPIWGSSRTSAFYAPAAPALLVLV